jgi:hypothetical protein
VAEGLPDAATADVADRCIDGAALCVKEGVPCGVAVPLSDGDGDAASEGGREADAVSVGVAGTDALPLVVADSLPLPEALTTEGEGEPLCSGRGAGDGVSSQGCETR